MPPGRLNVGEQRVDFAAVPNILQCLVAGGGRVYGETAPAQPVGDQTTDQRFICHEQNGWLRCGAPHGTLLAIAVSSG